MGKKNRLKRMAAIAVASMLLCGFSAQAAEGTNQVTEHTHSYEDSKKCTGSTLEYQHSFYNNETGKYEICDIVIFFYHYESRCKICGEIKHDYYDSERVHIKCGQ